MLTYGFNIRSSATWDKYLSPLAASEFHSTRFYIDSGFDTGKEPSIQYVAGPNNYLTTTVTATPRSDVTLTYYLQVCKLKLNNGVIAPVGAYGIDPTITIKAA